MAYRDKSQHRAKVREIYRRKSDFVWEYKSTHPCNRCKETDPCCLVFHHAKGDKEADVCDMVKHMRPIEVIKAEISKCNVLCRNCHSKLHAEERKCLMLKNTKENTTRKTAAS